MKIIEAMKRIKDNKEKISDLQKKISGSCANLSIETPVYKEETPKKIKEFLQSCLDLSQENVRLLTAIQRTNLQTPVTIEIDGQQVTKTIAEWVWRRREYAALDRSTILCLSDRGLRGGIIPSSTGEKLEATIVLHYDPEYRDKMMERYRSEPSRIDGTLEVVNAVTDLIEG